MTGNVRFFLLFLVVFIFADDTVIFPIFWEFCSLFDYSHRNIREKYTKDILIEVNNITLLVIVV